MLKFCQKKAQKRAEKEDDSGEVCYLINMGERDDYDWKTPKGFLKVTLNSGRDDVSKVGVKNSFSFFNTETDQADLMMNTFTDLRMDGRFINVEISDKGAGRSRSNKKDGESRRKREDEKKGEKKGERRNHKQKTVEAFEQVFRRKKKRR